MNNRQNMGKGQNSRGSAGDNTKLNAGSKTTSSGVSSRKAGNTSKATSAKASTGKKDNDVQYILISFVLNLILGGMGVGMGFVFFVAEVITTGAIIRNVCIFIIGAIAIVIYLFIILGANKWVVRLCSDHKSKKKDNNRLFWSMVFGVCVLVISFAYSFLCAAL